MLVWLVAEMPTSECLRRSCLRFAGDVLLNRHIILGNKLQNGVMKILRGRYGDRDRYWYDTRRHI
jgi:hypothetical protein